MGDHFCVASRGDNYHGFAGRDDCHVLLHGGETNVMMLHEGEMVVFGCFNKERRLSCVVTWRGDNCHGMLDGGDACMPLVLHPM